MRRNNIKELLSHNVVRKTAAIAVMAICMTYPMSHEPAILGILSPFQFLALFVAGVGVISAGGWLWRHLPTLHKKYRYYWNTPLTGGVLFLLWMTISLLWGHGPQQLYFIGLMWVGFFFAVGFYILALKSGRDHKVISRLIVIAAVAISLVSLYQFTGESFGIQRAYTQICMTCGEEGVGVARSSGFSAEPQYLSFLLLLPLTLLLHGIFWKKKLFSPVREWLFLGIIFFPFLLGSSRGGFLALALVLAAYALVGMVKKQYRLVFALVFTLLASLLCTMGLVGWSGSLPNKAGVDYALERYISHSTGGVVTLGGEEERMQQIEQKIEERRSQKQQTTDEFNYVEDAQDFGQSGAVIYSTQSRLETYHIAFKVWTQDVTTILLGVGWGSFGVAAAEASSAYSETNVVNNQLLQILTELGVVGVVLFMVAVALLVRYLYHSLWPYQKSMFITIIILLGAYFIQLQFFSAPHLIQLWFTLGLLYWIATTFSAKKQNSPHS